MRGPKFYKAPPPQRNLRGDAPVGTAIGTKFAPNYEIMTMFLWLDWKKKLFANNEFNPFL